MKISKIKVKNYGPIKEFSAQCGKIEIFYGRNEAGKTALVDAITTALFKRRDIFSHQDRFEGKNFEVRVKNKGEEYSFPGKKKFSEITNLPHYQLARLFIVRAGELTLREDEKWWDSVKEFLSGISVKINRLIEKINDRVGITSSGDWSNRHPDYIKTEIEKMKTRKKELEISIGNLKQIQDKEKELEKKQKEKASLKKKLEDFYRYQEYLRYEQANKAYEEYKRQKQILLDYQRCRREDLDKWREKEGREKDIEREKLILQQNMENLKKEIKDDQGEENRLIKKHQELIQKRDRANLFSINDKFFRFKVQSEALNSKKLKKFLWVGEGLFSVGAIFLLLSVFFIFFFYLGWPILVGGGVLLFLYANLQRRKNKLKREEKEILKVSRNIWEDCQDVWSIPSLWEKFQNSLSILQGRLSKIREEKDKKIKKLKEMEEKFEKLKRGLDRVGEEINQIRDKIGVSEPLELERKIEEKRDIEKIIERDKNILVDTLKTDEPYLWEERLQKKIIKPDIEIIFSPGEERELKEDIKHNDKEIERLKEEILAFREGELGRLGIKEEPQIWIELGKLNKDLENYNRQRQAALLARSILTKVSEELNEELLKVINDEKMGVSAYFSYITGGKYQKVEWREGSIYIQDKGGTSYSAKDLSTGTLDQLLFSLRLSILKGALPEGGFFVLDDAFLTSDYERRRKLVKICRDLSCQKWQILYFTVDDHLRDLFSQICGIKPKVL